MATAAKKPRFSSCDISELTDNDLTEIFKHLASFNRLIVSEVCRRWHELSRNAWLDINHLDLTPIPGESLGAILKHCPRLQTARASQKSFGLNELAGLSKIPSVASLKFYGCKLQLTPAAPGRTYDVFAEIFSDQLEHASLSELVLYDAHFWQARAANIRQPRWSFDASFLPVSLTHLQCSDFYATQSVKRIDSLFLHGLERLQNLECFILNTAPVPLGKGPAFCDFIWSGLDSLHQDIFEKLGSLKNLRELCVGPPIFFGFGGFEELIANLPKLEVLFLINIDCDLFDTAALDETISESSVLRILVLSGEFHIDEELSPFPFGPRKRFPHGFGADPLPLLHIFVGRGASENLLFPTSSSDAAIIHPINAPMPEFLKRADIAPIFEGVWVAKKIKDAAENDARLWDYELHDDTDWIQELNDH